MVQGYRGVNINSRHNEESLGEMYRKDDIDVSNQGGENLTANSAAARRFIEDMELSMVNQEHMRL